MNRIQYTQILKDLEKKMVFLVGPRQAGKTWLAQQVATAFERSLYLNHDHLEDRQLILEQAWLPDTELLILDELHKMPEWKNYLKGLYDTKPTTMRVIVTGSASLDILQHLGDSLAGRYFIHHLLPFSAAELHQLGTDFTLERLIQHSGFPEPWLAPDETETKRWRLQYINSLLSTDVFEIEPIRNLQAMRTVFDLLRQRVGAPTSYQSIAGDVGVSPSTVKKYIQVLEALYIVFRVTPYAKNIARSLLKEPKLYFFDTGLVQGDAGAQLENLVGLALLKHCYAKRDYAAEPYALHYLRTKEQQEVDFALACDNEIKQIIEVKHAERNLSAHLKYFHEKYDYPAIQVVQHLRQERQYGNIQLRKANTFLRQLLL